MTVDTESKVHIYEIDGIETKVGSKKHLHVRNVWNRKNLIELQVGESGEKIVVHYRDLDKAMNNAINNEF